MINRVTWRLLKADPCYNNERMNLNWPIGALEKDNPDLALHPPPNSTTACTLNRHGDWDFLKANFSLSLLTVLQLLPEDKQVFLCVRLMFASGALIKCWVSSFESLLSHDLWENEIVSGSILERIMMETFLLLWYIIHELRVLWFSLSWGWSPSTD
jgi:hypothetical protein